MWGNTALDDASPGNMHVFRCACMQRRTCRVSLSELATSKRRSFKNLGAPFAPVAASVLACEPAFGRTMEFWHAYGPCARPRCRHLRPIDDDRIVPLSHLAQTHTHAHVKLLVRGSISQHIARLCAVPRPTHIHVSPIRNRYCFAARWMHKRPPTHAPIIETHSFPAIAQLRLTHTVSAMQLSLQISTGRFGAREQRSPRDVGKTRQTPFCAALPPAPLRPLFTAGCGLTSRT
jgi:hypothetical protein